MKPDPFSDEEGKYVVRSIYFDNYNDKALMEKVNGVNNREKFRIRLYNNDFSFIKLEKKSKTDGLCFKKSTRISYDECKKILDDDIDWMGDSKDEVIVELYMKMKNDVLKPKTIVEYTREAYLYKPGSVRITIDSNIRTGLFSRDFLNPNLPMVSPYPKGYCILEVKYDEFLPQIVSDLIQTNIHMSSSVSKYAVCRLYG